MNIDEWRTYLVTAASRSAGRTTPEVVAAALEGGLDVVQLRDKAATDRERYETGRRLRELTAEAGVPPLVNDPIGPAAAPLLSPPHRLPDAATGGQPPPPPPPAASSSASPVSNTSPNS